MVRCNDTTEEKNSGRKEWRKVIRWCCCPEKVTVERVKLKCCGTDVEAMDERHYGRAIWRERTEAKNSGISSRRWKMRKESKVLTTAWSDVLERSDPVLESLARRWQFKRRFFSGTVISWGVDGSDVWQKETVMEETCAAGGREELGAAQVKESSRRLQDVRHTTLIHPCDKSSLLTVYIEKDKLDE